MDALGVWKIRNAQQFDAATMKLVDKNVDDILADTSIPEDDKQMLRAKFIFKDDGYVYTALQGGSIMHKWTNDERMMIACCNDGTHPVIFKIERIDIPETEDENEWLKRQNFKNNAEDAYTG